MSISLRTSLAAVAVIASGAFALAQQPQQGMGGMNGMGGTGMTMPGMHMSPGCMMMSPGQMQGMGMGGMGGMGGGMMMGLPIEQRLIQLKSQLAITDAQSAAWDTYAKAATAHATAHKTNHETMMKAMHSGSAVDRVDAHLKSMEAMVASLKDYKPALEALYGFLNDQQKQLANNLLGPGCMM